MPIDPFTRRTTLKLSGALAATGLAGVTSARRADRRDVNELRLFSEMETNEGRGARDVIPYGNYGLIADSKGMTVVGWRNPGRLRTVAEVNGRGPDINDVKVGGDLAGLASDGGNEVTFFDMSDPENPEELGFYDAGSGIHNHYIDGEHAYLTVNESTLIDTDGDGDPDEIIVFGETRMEVVDVNLNCWVFRIDTLRRFRFTPCHWFSGNHRSTVTENCGKGVIVGLRGWIYWPSPKA